MTAIDHRQIVAATFRVISLAIGVPSSIAFAFLSWSAVRLHMSNPQLSPAAPSGDALIDLLVSGARTFGQLAAFVGGAGKWFITLLAVASLVCVGFAALLPLTARGLYAGRAWARVVGILLTVLTLLVSLGALTAVGRPVTLIAFVALTVFSVYAIWALGWHFSS
jgi:hypothetical protein